MNRRARETWRGEGAQRRGRGRRWRAAAMAAVVVAGGVVAIRPWSYLSAGAEQVGVAGDVVAAADWDGDGRTDRAVWRPSNGRWVSVSSANGHAVETPGFGLAGDIPVPADYDGDGTIDRAVYRPSKGRWYLAQSTAGTVERVWGIDGDIPVPGDYDGDGKADLALYRPGQGRWHIAQSTAGQVERNWGINGDIPVPGDYDGDGKADLALYRPGQGHWHIAQSTAGQVERNWGVNGDIPAPGDYDRDGKSDLALYRPGDRNWYIYGIQPPAACSWEWPPGKVFAPGESYVTCEGDRFTFQTDGNLVGYDITGQPTWSSGTAGQAAGGRLEFQAGDGNLVIYTQTNQPAWATNALAPQGTLALDGTANLVVYGQGKDPKWVQLEKNKKKLLEAIDKYTEQLTKDHDSVPPLVTDPEYALQMDRAAHLKRIINQYDPRQWCTAGPEILGALIGVTGTTKSLYEMLKQGATGLFWRASAITSVLLAWFSIVKVLEKCEEWKRAELLLEDFRSQNDGGGAGQIHFRVPRGSDSATWIDNTPIGQDADFVLAYEGEDDYYTSVYVDFTWEYVDSLCCAGSGGGGGGGGGGRGGDGGYLEWFDYVDEIIS